MQNMLQESPMAAQVFPTYRPKIAIPPQLVQPQLVPQRPVADDITVRLDTYGRGSFDAKTGNFNARGDDIVVTASGEVRNKNAGVSLVLSVDTPNGTQRMLIELDTSNSDGVITSMRFIE